MSANHGVVSPPNPLDPCPPGDEFTRTRDNSVDPGIQVKDRQNVREIAFHDPSSLVYQAIQEDDVNRLRYLLGLGGFGTRGDSFNHSVLYLNDGSGVVILLSLCIEAGAAHCLYYVAHWCRSPRNPFTYDIKWLYGYAFLHATRTGRPECLLALESASALTDPDTEARFAFVLTQATSPEGAEQLVDMISRAKGIPLDCYPFLMLKCADPSSQPALLEYFASQLDSYETINEVDYCRGRMIGPLPVATSLLHTTAIELLLRLGADPFEPRDFNKLMDNEYHGLFCVLDRRLPMSPRQLMDSEADGETANLKLSPQQRRETILRWRAQLHPVAARMRDAAALLINSTSRAFQEDPQYQHLLARAAKTCLSTIRRLIFRAILRMTDTPTQDHLLSIPRRDSSAGPRKKKRAKKEKEKEKEEVAASDSEEGGGGGGGEAKIMTYFTDRDKAGVSDSDFSLNASDADDAPLAPRIAFRSNLTPTKLKEALTRRRLQIDGGLLELWDLLVTPDLVQVVENYLARSTDITPMTTERCLYTLLVADKDDELLGPLMTEKFYRDKKKREKRAARSASVASVRSLSRPPADAPARDPVGRRRPSTTPTPGVRRPRSAATSSDEDPIEPGTAEEFLTRRRRSRPQPPA